MQQYPQHSQMDMLKQHTPLNLWLVVVCGLFCACLFLICFRVFSSSTLSLLLIAIKAAESTALLV